jgi:hypothetical protein
MANEVALDELERALTQLVGPDRSREMVRAALNQAHILPKPKYTRDELRRICDNLRTHGGMVSVVVSAVAVRLTTGT